ncbi:hypothetical protein SK355_06355 [Candidatus Fukatsuia symbiotica]|nr:hypothetical protein [Candidatus Fukatsuia symbiotica]MEA9444898.1 hypothetical protein [Candidatus Fukatsuia symbiotica]
MKPVPNLLERRSDEEKMREKAQFTLCIQQEGVNEHFERVFDE